MTDILEKRLTDLETLVWELPDLMTTRMARVDTELVSLRASMVEYSQRAATLERAMMVLQTDIRDMRGGVTRMLVAQDERLADVDKRLAGVETRLTGVETRLTGVETRLTGQDQQFVQLNAKLDAILARLPAA